MATQATDSSKYRLRSSAADELAVIAQRAQAFTNASGAAIALSEGTADEIVCRARSGSSAPDVGVALRVEGSFTGLCIQSGKELRCDDAETDTRVNRESCKALGIASVVVMPLQRDQEVNGVFELFSGRAYAFEERDITALQRLAEMIQTALEHADAAQRAEQEIAAKLEPPATDVYFADAVFLYPPLTDEYRPLALFRFPPLTDAYRLVA